MPIAKKLAKFLSKIKYEPIEHRTVYTAYDKAQTLKIPEKTVGKTLVMKMNGDFAIVLVSANQILDKVKFKKTVNSWRKKLGQKSVKEIRFATEVWMKKNLKGVKIGAIPPFGNLWRFPTFVEKSLLKNPTIIANAGDYNVSIKINSNLFKKLIPDLAVGNFGKKK
jgi:Ala-tRNA(Pro) deacylase